MRAHCAVDQSLRRVVNPFQDLWVERVSLLCMRDVMQKVRRFNSITNASGRASQRERKRITQTLSTKQVGKNRLER